MNNFTFGNKYFGYYETIGGGAGAYLLDKSVNYDKGTLIS